MFELLLELFSGRFKTDGLAGLEFKFKLEFNFKSFLPLGILRVFVDAQQRFLGQILLSLRFPARPLLFSQLELLNSAHFELVNHQQTGFDELFGE